MKNQEVYMIKVASIIMVLFSIASCKPADETEISIHIQDLDNLTVIETEGEKMRKVHLERETEFGSSNDLIIGGLGSFTVDEANRVYIGDTQQYTIYISDKIFKDQRHFLTATVSGEPRSTRFNFMGKTMIAVSEEGQVHIARSQDFLIRIFDKEGVYKKVLYHPFKKRQWTRANATRKEERNFEEGVTEYRTSVIHHAEEEDLPETWPALNDLLVDDESRIWVSTVIDDDEEYEWWVLDSNGTVLARFHWPVNEPIEFVKNGYLYTRETEEETGLQEVIRYRIEMTS